MSTVSITAPHKIKFTLADSKGNEIETRNVPISIQENLYGATKLTTIPFDCATTSKLKIETIAIVPGKTLSLDSIGIRKFEQPVTLHATLFHTFDIPQRSNFVSNPNFEGTAGKNQVAWNWWHYSNDASIIKAESSNILTIKYDGSSRPPAAQQIHNKLYPFFNNRNFRFSLEATATTGTSVGATMIFNQGTENRMQFTAMKDGDRTLGEWIPYTVDFNVKDLNIKNAIIDIRTVGRPETVGSISVRNIRLEPID